MISLLAILLLLVPSVLFAGTSCVWGEWASDTCNCARYEKEMAHAIDGDPTAQFRVWELMMFSNGYIDKPFLPTDKKLTHLPAELERCAASIMLEGREALKEKGIKWLEQAAQAGHTEAQYFLGMHIWDKESDWEELRITKANLILCKVSKFRMWRGRCAKISNLSLEFTELTRKNVDEEREWVNSKTFEREYSPQIEELIRRAAEAKHVQAQFALAQILEEGVGVPMDEVQAQVWRIIGTAQNPPFGANIRDGFLATEWLTKDELEKADVMAEKFMHKYTDVWKNPSLTIIR